MHKQHPEVFANRVVAEQKRKEAERQHKEAENAILLELISDLKLADSYGRIVTEELVVKARRLA